MHKVGGKKDGGRGGKDPLFQQHFCEQVNDRQHEHAKKSPTPINRQPKGLKPKSRMPSVMMLFKGGGWVIS